MLSDKIEGRGRLRGFLQRKGTAFSQLACQQAIPKTSASRPANRCKPANPVHQQPVRRCIPANLIHFPLLGGRDWRVCTVSSPLLRLAFGKPQVALIILNEDKFIPANLVHSRRRNGRNRRVRTDSGAIRGFAPTGHHRWMGCWLKSEGSALKRSSRNAKNSPLGRSIFLGLKSGRRPLQSKRPMAGACVFMVVRGGLEPSARGFSVRCSTN